MRVWLQSACHNMLTSLDLDCFQEFQEYCIQNWCIVIITTRAVKGWCLNEYTVLGPVFDVCML